MQRVIHTAIAGLAGTMALSAALAGFALKYYPRTLALPSLNPLPQIRFEENGHTVLSTPAHEHIGLLATFEDELFAYLMFDYLRGQRELAGREVLISYAPRAGAIEYSIYVRLPNDVFAAAQLHELAAPYPFLTPVAYFVDPRVLADFRSRTRTFEAAYNFPGYRPLERLTRAEVLAYAQRFIRLKSNVDPRIRRRIDPVPQPLTPQQARQLAEDIVTVAEFYDLPLDLFLGIGAMENNYMNVRGDLDHAVWKPRAERGDIVLRRRGGRVLVLNPAEGVWQITRETLRVAHRLYQRDRRDYSALPEPLRPPEDLDIAAVEPRLLTTYAGLLFRDLLDRFQGDAARAVGAYNGGPGNPNAKYAAGVRAAAAHARRVMEQVSALRGQRIAETQFLRPAPWPQEPPAGPSAAVRLWSSVRTLLSAR
jgi:hypothetical protein